MNSSTELPGVDLDGLERLARAATPGEWFAGPRLEDELGCIMFSIGNYPLADNKPHHYEDSICEVWGNEFDGEANSKYIAAANPQTILSLLHLLRAAQAPVTDGEREELIGELRVVYHNWRSNTPLCEAMAQTLLSLGYRKSKPGVQGGGE